MPFRYRLLDGHGNDVGPLIAKRDWRVGDQISRSHGEDLVIIAIVAPEADAGFRAYLVVAPAKLPSS